MQSLKSFRTIISKRLILRYSKRLFQLFLVAFAIFSLFVGSSVIQGGVNASIIPANNPGVQQCGGGGCPVPTTTGGGGCNPYNWMYVDSTYGVKILSADTDKPAYNPGETVTITGTLEAMHQDMYVNECGEYGSTDPVQDNAGLVKLGLSGAYGGTIANEGGSFTATVNLPLTAESGAVTYTVIATYESANDQRDVTFEVNAFTPSLSVAMSHGTFVYPGETFTVSGSGWAPNGMVSLDYGSLSSGAQVAVSSSGTFTAPSIAVPSDAAEDSYTVTGTEAPNLEASASVPVQWRQLVIALNPTPIVQQGDNVPISGTVKDNEGKSVEGVTVSFEVNVLSSPSSTSTDASGQFSASMTVPSDAKAQTYGIAVTAEKTPGYKSASASVNLQVTERPPFPNLTDVGVAVAGAAGGAAGGLVATGGGGEDGDGEEEGKPPPEEPPPPLEKPPPCQDELQELRDASQRAKAIQAMLQFLRNQHNALETAYEDARQTGFWEGTKWAAELALMGALGFEQNVGGFAVEGAYSEGLGAGGEAFLKTMLKAYPQIEERLGGRLTEILTKWGADEIKSYGEGLVKGVIDSGVDQISGIEPGEESESLLAKAAGHTPPPSALSESLKLTGKGRLKGGFFEPKIGDLFEAYKKIAGIKEHMEKMEQVRETLSEIQRSISQAQSDFEDALQDMQIARDLYNKCMGLKQSYGTLQAAEDATTSS